jgi:hypothetical protein
VAKSNKEKNQEFLDNLAAHLRAQQEKPEATASNGHATATTRAEMVSDEAIIEKCRGAKNAAKFADLYDAGDVNTHHNGDDSVADLALLGILAYWTQDQAQLERLFSASALGQRAKWRSRADYRRRTIQRALSDLGEVYDWTRNERGRYRHRHRHPIKVNDDDDSRFASISFAEMAEPEKPEEVWEGVIVRGWPALWFGGTGVTKSVTAMAVAQAIADEHTKVLLGRNVITAPVMYADWELNEMVQGRRAYQIARGRGRLAPPPGLRYMSTYGAARRDRQDFIANVLDECIDHSIEVCFIDSVGLAVSGNPGDFEVIVEFFEEVVADFTANGITPVLIDHQRRLIPGERNQALGAYGSVWKENLSRTQLQIELVRRDRDAHTITTRLRPKKTNFGELPEPIEVKTTFSEEAIKLEVTETDDTDRAAEETVSAGDRVLAAIRTLGAAGPNAIWEACSTLKKGTVKNEITKLRRAGIVEDTGEVEPGGGKIVIVTGTYRDDDDDDDSKTTPGQRIVRMLYEPPEWLATQLKRCREDPKRYFDATCAAISREVFEDSHRGEEVAPVLQAHLDQEPLY